MTPALILCIGAVAIDNDTMRCANLGPSIRLAAIDAPEQPGHCRKARRCTPGDPYAAQAELQRLLARGPVTCRAVDTDRYGRIVAFCAARGVQISCAMVASGHAVERYRRLEGCR
ncbi:MAG: thermonuclease family protein [Sphingomonadaceae bacterium]|nr:thermonuclease family protein [Sphingomonadaceae bacterium]